MDYYKYKDKDLLIKQVSPYFNVHLFNDDDLYNVIGVLCINKSNYNLQFQKGFYSVFGINEEDYSDFNLNRLIDEISENIVDYKDTNEKIHKMFEDIKSSKFKVAFIDNVFYDTGDLIKCFQIYFENISLGGEPSLLIVAKNDNILIEDKLELLELNNQKDILLKEVHHRVKNNLQILNSLINIQQRFGLSDYEIIKSMKLFISSMAIVHEKLYSDNSNFGFVLLDSFFKKFKNNLLDLYSGMGINFVFDVENDLYLDIKLMMPFSLILNELIINSIKYAYPKEFEGKKEILCSIKSEGNLCKFYYTDYGVGLSNELSDDSLGTILVKSLVNQIDGEFRVIDSDKGFSCVIEFPIDNK